MLPANGRWDLIRRLKVNFHTRTLHQSMDLAYNYIYDLVLNQDHRYQYCQPIHLLTAIVYEMER